MSSSIFFDQEAIRGAIVTMKAGWKQARDDGVDITPQLRKALIEDAGVHPDRVRAYVDALMDQERLKPDINDYKDPAIIPFSRFKP